MRDLHFTSIATSVFWIVVSGATMVYSAGLTKFEADAFDRPYASPDAAASFVNFVGLRVSARVAMAKGEGFPRNASREEIENVLVVEPTNGVFWLGLAEKHYQSGDPNQRISALVALRMSEVVQPLESKAMVLRIVFILNHWEDLPPSDRRLAADHIVALGENLSDEERESVARSLVDKTETSRKEIEEEVVDRDNGDRRLLAWLGL